MTETEHIPTSPKPVFLAWREGDMKRLFVAAGLAAALVGAGCQQAAVDAPEWFTGTFEEALASAQSRSTMLMLDFYSPN
jgi:hypothetical protein